MIVAGPTRSAGADVAVGDLDLGAVPEVDPVRVRPVLVVEAVEHRDRPDRDPLAVPEAHVPERAVSDVDALEHEVLAAVEAQQITRPREVDLAGEPALQTATVPEARALPIDRPLAEDGDVARVLGPDQVRVLGVVVREVRAAPDRRA